MESRKRRENTFRIDFSTFPKKPTYKEIHRFVANDLGLPRDQTKRIQISDLYNCAFITTADLATAQQIVQNNDNKHELECNKKKYKVRLYMEDGTTQVRLYELSEDITNEQIVECLSKYGDVQSVRELFWSDDYEYHGIPSGIQQARIVLKQHIKSFITIGGETARVQYTGQRATCRHCGEYVHNGIPCVQNKKLLLQKVSANERLKQTNTVSYAGVLRSSGLTTRQYEDTTDGDMSETDIRSTSSRYSRLDSSIRRNQALTKPVDLTGQRTISPNNTMQPRTLHTNSANTGSLQANSSTALLTVPSSSLPPKSHITPNTMLPPLSTKPTDQQQDLFKPPPADGNLSGKHPREDGGDTDTSNSSRGRRMRNANKKPNTSTPTPTKSMETDQQ